MQALVPTPLLSMTLDELAHALGSRSRAVATLRWLHQGPRRTELPDELPGVSHRVWKPFKNSVSLAWPAVAARLDSDEGTTKYALTFADGAQVETVRIPAEGRSTVCISSQAGCTRRCRFCATKELGFLRQLTADEMVAQFAIARAEAPAETPARNVVFMGMGEPFDNLDAVLRATELLTQSPSPQLKLRSVTVSTSGVLPGLKRFLAESKASLALSLNATTDAMREQLMPHTKTWPIQSLLEELRRDAVTEPKRDHFIEYVMFDGLNDTDDDATRLIALLQGIRARVNLIPFNRSEIPLRDAADLFAPQPERMLAFQRRLIAAGLLCLIRWPRGRQISAACGQLALARLN